MKRLIRRIHTILRDERGNSLIISVISFPVLLLFLAFVLDLGSIQIVRSHLQTAADAGSLAGVTFSDQEYYIDTDSFQYRTVKKWGWVERTRTISWTDPDTGEIHHDTETYWNWEVIDQWEVIDRCTAYVQLNNSLAKSRSSSMVVQNFDHIESLADLIKESYYQRFPGSGTGKIAYRLELDVQEERRPESLSEYWVVNVRHLSTDPGANIYTNILTAKADSLLVGPIMSKIYGKKFEGFKLIVSSESEFFESSAIEALLR